MLANRFSEDMSLPVATPKPIHPGLIAETLYMAELSITRQDLEKQLGASRQFVRDLLEGREDVTTELAEKLAAFFGTSVNIWINMQSDYNRVYKKG